jgi:hypothetical protein
MRRAMRRAMRQRDLVTPRPEGRTRLA